MSGALPNCVRLVGIRFIGSRQASSQVKSRYIQHRHLQTTCIRYDKVPSEEPVKETKIVTESSSKHQVSVFEEMYRDQPKALTPVQKVVEDVKTTGYLFIIVGGLCMFCVLVYTFTSEFLGDLSPTNVFTKTMKQIKAHERANAILGDNIRGFGDTMSRSRKNLQHQEYIVDGIEYMRVVYQIEGSKRKGQVIVDIKKSKKGKKYRYIIIQLEGYPAGKISILDNRHETDIEDLPDVDYTEVNKEFDISK